MTQLARDGIVVRQNGAPRYALAYVPVARPRRRAAIVSMRRRMSALRRGGAACSTVGPRAITCSSSASVRSRLGARAREAHDECAQLVDAHLGRARVVDPGRKGARREFQGAHGLELTGELDARTLRLILSAA